MGGSLVVRESRSMADLPKKSGLHFRELRV